MLSKEALRRLYYRGHDPLTPNPNPHGEHDPNYKMPDRGPGTCAEDGPAEDEMMGRCLAALGVKTGNTTDSKVRG